MPTSTFLARLIGPVMLVMGAAVLVDRAAFRDVAQDVLRSPALLFLSGMLALVAGLAIVLTHNVWVGNWRVIITLLGWLMTIGGATRILAPAQTRRVGEAMLARVMTVCVAGGVVLALGAVLSFFGYFR